MVPRHARQAVVIVHGMGEQRPLDALAGFIDTALPPDDHGQRRFYSRPESVTGSYESRRFLAPYRAEDATDRDSPEVYANTEFYEYHWADRMQGNRLDDLWPTTRRILFLPPTRVPHGLWGLWLVAWGLILGAVYMFAFGPWADVWEGEGAVTARLVSSLVSGGIMAALVTFVLSRVLPNWLTASFVDVVRYLDTSPRSYAVRREIRKGLVEMLTALHESRKYDRIILVAHSLGGFIAYDAIAYLWGRMNHVHSGSRSPPELSGLRELEQAASALPDASGTHRITPDVDDDALCAFQEAQRSLFKGLRAQGNPWRISDLVTVGTPMYFADRLLEGRGARTFTARVQRREFPVCPPANEEGAHNNINGTLRFYSWPRVNVERTRTTTGTGRTRVGRRVLYEGAPFAVVRWTNLYYPACGHFFGDWFGGPLRPLFGSGIRDVAVTGNRPGGQGANLFRNRFVPGLAHALYFSFPDDPDEDGAAAVIRRGMDLASTEWLSPSGMRAKARNTTRPAGPAAPVSSD